MEPIDLTNAQPFPFHPAWSVLGFPAFWCLVSYLIGHIGDWSTLHQRYGGPPGPVPPGRSLLAGRIGMAKYNGVLRIAHDQLGLYLSVMLLFRVGHPPLFIPWSEIGDVERTKAFLTERVRFSVGHPRITTLELPPSALKGTMLDREGSTSVPH